MLDISHSAGGFPVETKPSPVCIINIQSTQKMINPLQLSLTTQDGSKRYIIVEPVLEKQGSDLHNTGTYRIYKDAFGEESTLFTEPLETMTPNTDLDDSQNPDYLGKIIINSQNNWTYTGDLLSPDEQKQIINELVS